MQTKPPLGPDAVDRLRRGWREVMTQVRERGGIRLQAALNTVRDISIGAGPDRPAGVVRVTLAFGSNEFTCDVVAEPAACGLVEAILGDVLGGPVRVINAALLFRYTQGQSTHPFTTG